MKKSEVKQYISHVVAVSYLKNDVPVVSQGVLHYFNSKTGLCEVWCENKDKVIVHYWNLRKLKSVTRAEQVDIKLDKFLKKKSFSKKDAEIAFQCLQKSLQVLRFYGDTRSWLETNNNKFLGEIMTVKHEKAKATVEYVERALT